MWVVYVLVNVLEIIGNPVSGGPAVYRFPICFPSFNRCQQTAVHTVLTNLLNSILAVPFRQSLRIAQGYLELLGLYKSEIVPTSKNASDEWVNRIT